MNKNNIIMIFAFVTFLASCTTEETREPIATINELSLELQSQFDSNEFIKVIPYEYNVDWSDTTKKYSDELEISYYEFPVQFTSTINPDIQNKIKETDEFYQKFKILVTEDINKKRLFYILKFYQNVNLTIKNLESEVFFNGSEDYSGFVHLLNSNDEMVYAKIIENGSIKSSKSFFEKTEKGSSITKRVEETCSSVTTYHYMDYYNVRENGVREYSHTRYLGQTVESSCEYNYYPEIRRIAGSSGTYQASSSNPYVSCGTKCLIDVEADILLIPSCRSFEYAAGVSNGIPSKVAGVTNLNNYFGTLKLRPDGTWFTHSMELNFTKLYFILPSYWLNGKAANATAKALRAANLQTKAWYLANPDATNDDLIRQWERIIKVNMKLLGGTVTKSPTFTIRSLAPYVEDFSWLPSNCE